MTTNIQDMTNEEFQAYIDAEAAKIEAEKEALEEKSKHLSTAEKNRQTIERLQSEIADIQKNAEGAKALCEKVEVLRDALAIKSLRTLSRTNAEVDAILRNNSGKSDPGASPNSALVNQLHTVTNRLRDKILPVAETLNVIEDLGARLDDATAGAVKERRGELAKLAGGAK